MQVFKLFNFFQFRVFQEKTRSEWLNLLSNFHNFVILDIEVHEIPNTPLMQTIQFLLKQFKITSRVNDSRTFTVISIKGNSTARKYYFTKVTNKYNKKNPNKEPWGTPDETSDQEEVIPSSTTLCRRLLK